MIHDFEHAGRGALEDDGNQQIEFQAMRKAFQADLASEQAAQDQLAAQPAAALQPVPQAVPPPEVSLLTICLPTFWVASPELWCAQVEASFETRNPKITTDTSKYNHLSLIHI